MPIRVAFNATPLLSTLTGIGNYIVELGAALARCQEVDAYSFYRYRWRHEGPTPPESGAHGHIDLMVDRMRPHVPFRGSLRHAARHLGFRGGLKRFRIDLYHEQNYIPLAFDVPVVITVHDLSWFRYPSSHPIDRVRWLERYLPKAVERASVILVDSDFVRDEVLITFGVDETRVLTTHLGVTSQFSPRSEAQCAETLLAKNLRFGQYVLAVGTVEPRKNLHHIVTAYLQLPPALRTHFPLVIAGAKGWQSSDLLSRIRQAATNEIRFLGHVSQRQLPDLYAGAALFTFPSLYEGFGLPPLEAMACGVPVLVSNRASLPEVVGNAGMLMNPEDPLDTAAQLRTLLEDREERSRMAARGLLRARQFTWPACANRTLEGYRLAMADAMDVSLLGGGEGGRGTADAY